MPNEEKPSAEAQAEGICHTEAECKKLYSDIPAEKKAPALEMLRQELAEVASLIDIEYRSDPKEWWVGYHFEWGMAVRNLLREKGFGEEYFGIHNLDDIYVPLVEEALGLKIQY